MGNVHIYDRVLIPNNEAKTRGSSYMQVQKYTEVSGHEVADIGSSLGGHLLCEVAL